MGREKNKTKQKNPKTPCHRSALFSPAVASSEWENVFNWNHRTSSQPTLNGFLCAAFCQSFKQDCTRKEKNVVFTDTQPCKNNSDISSQCIHCSSLTVSLETNRHVTLLPVGPRGGFLVFLVFAWTPLSYFALPSLQPDFFFLVCWLFWLEKNHRYEAQSCMLSNALGQKHTGGISFKYAGLKREPKEIRRH